MENIWNELLPKLAQAITKAIKNAGQIIIADARVAQALFKRAIGFFYDEVTFEKIDSKGTLGSIGGSDLEMYKKKVVKKYVIPDTGAAISWLKNRQKDNWRDKQTVEFEKYVRRTTGLYRKQPHKESA